MGSETKLLELKISSVTQLQSRMWPYHGSWARSQVPQDEVFKELRGQGILYVLNIDDKVTQDDGKILHDPETAWGVEKMLNLPSRGFWDKGSFCSRRLQGRSRFSAEAKRYLNTLYYGCCGYRKDCVQHNNNSL